jgi:hypothetical protein
MRVNPGKRLFELALSPRSASIDFTSRHGAPRELGA